MADFEKLYKELVQIVGKENVKREEPLSMHTTFRIGGEAKLFVTPSDVDELEKVLVLVRESGGESEIQHFLIGNGSNLLVRDAGFSGVIISTHKKGQKGIPDGFFGLEDYCVGFRNDYPDLWKQFLEREGISFSGEAEGKHLVLSGSGILLSALANGIAEAGLEGFEFASGIPGTLGGAVAMNAGAYGGEIKDCLLGAEVLMDSGEGLERKILSGEELELGYRSSRIQSEHMIVLRALFSFPEGEPEKIRKTMNELNERRREKQPLNFGSAGSTFKRPEGYFAGKLIEDAGLKGYRVGDVMVSEKHAGFVVNVGKGTYEQAMAVIRHVQETVREKFGVILETEVKIL